MITTMTRILSGFILLIAAGCASEPGPRMLSPYHEDDFRTWTQSGKGSLSGQAFLKIPNGRVITCAGGDVTLIPANSYNLELEQILENGKGLPSDYEHNAHKFERKTMCDAQGRFAFQNLPQLNWILIARVSWQEPSNTSWVPWTGPVDKGGYLLQEIKIGDDPKTVTLSNADYVEDRN